MSLALPLSRVTGYGAGSATSIASSAQAHVAGNALFALVTAHAVSATNYVLSNSALDTWYLLGTVQFFDAWTQVWYTPRTNGHATDVVTASFSSFSFRGITVLEVPGARPDLSLITALVSTTGNGTVATSPSAAVTAAHELLISYGVSDQSQASVTPGSGFTAGGLVGPFFYDESKLVTASQTAAMTWGASNSWGILSFTIKEARPATPVFAVTINGSAKDIQGGHLGLNIQSAAPLNRSTMSCDIYSSDGSYIPSVGDDIKASIDGDLLFGGLIQQIETRGVDDELLTGIYTRVDASDYGTCLDQRLVTEDFPAQTLKTTLTTLITNYLAANGISLATDQPTGPTLGMISFASTRAADVLSYFMNASSGYIPRVNYSKVLGMYLPSSARPAPWSVTANAQKILHDLTVRRARQSYYANIVTVRYGVSGHYVEWDDPNNTFFGPGTTSGVYRYWQLAPLAANWPYGIGSGAIRYTVSGVDYVEDVWTGGGASSGNMWAIGPNSTIYLDTRELAALTSGDHFTFRYEGAYPASVSATNSGEVSAVGPIELIVLAPDIFDTVSAQTLATTVLARVVQTPKTIRYQTDQLGLDILQTQSIVVPLRGLNGSYLITELQIRPNVDNVLMMEVTAVEGSIAPDTWRTSWRNL